MDDSKPTGRNSDLVLYFLAALLGNLLANALWSALNVPPSATFWRTVLQYMAGRSL